MISDHDIDFDFYWWVCLQIVVWPVIVIKNIIIAYPSVEWLVVVILIVISIENSTRDGSACTLHSVVSMINCPHYDDRDCYDGHCYHHYDDDDDNTFTIKSTESCRQWICWLTIWFLLWMYNCDYDYNNYCNDDYHVA